MANVIQRRVISRERAEELLEPLLPIFRERFDEAWRWSQSCDPEVRAVGGSAVMSALLNKKFLQLITPDLEAMPGIKIETTGPMKRFRTNEIALRFKKFDNNLRSGNIRTKKQFGIYYQLGLFEESDRTTSLTFGYCLDESGTRIRGLYITCPKSFTENHWMIVIEDATSEALPFASAAAQSAQRIPAVQPAFAPPRILPKVKKSKADGE